MIFKGAKAVWLASALLFSSSKVICAENISSMLAVLFSINAKHHKPESIEGWQTIWVTGTGTGVGVDAAAKEEEGSGMRRVPPTGMLFGLMPGFAALNASCEIPNCSASSLKVSPS